MANAPVKKVPIHLQVSVSVTASHNLLFLRYNKILDAIFVRF